MPKYSVPVAVTISGWFEVTAKNLEAAKKKAEGNLGEVDVGSLFDVDQSDEIFFDEIEEVK
jgi:hypothetical protein